MSAIVTFHNDLINALRSLKDKDQRGREVDAIKYINLWDNQIEEEISGESYSFSSPAAFIEFIPGEVRPLAAGYSSYPESEIRVHISQQLLNSKGGEMERNYPALELRSRIKKLLNGLSISYCSTLHQVYEAPDYKHTNVYTYSIGFRTNFIDPSGSYLDPEFLNTGYLVNPSVNLNAFHRWISGKQYVSKISETIFYEGLLGELYYSNDGAFYVQHDSYPQASVVSYRGDLYICMETNSDTEFDEGKWLKISFFDEAKGYSTGDIVMFNSFVWRNVEGQEGKFNSDNWEQISR